MNRDRNIAISGKHGESIMDLAEWCKKTNDYHFDSYDLAVMKTVEHICVKEYSDTGFNTLRFNWTEIYTMYQLLHCFMKEKCYSLEFESEESTAESNNPISELNKCLESKLGLRHEQIEED